MSVEHQPTPSQDHERASAELESMGREQLESLKANPEKSVEHAEQRAEAAREVINKTEPVPEPEPGDKEQEMPTPAVSFVARLDHALNYTQTLASVQRKLDPVSRSFSKAIHAPAIEKTSEALEGTVMRPSIVAGATWTAFITGLIFYLVARYYGFTLSGSEMLIALVAGAILGIVLEGLARLFRRRR
jgi:hypothetical protein